MSAQNRELSPVEQAVRAYHHGRRLVPSLPPVFENGSLYPDHTARDLDNFIAEGSPYRLRYPDGTISNTFIHGQDDGLGHGNLVPPGHLPPKRP